MLIVGAGIAGLAAANELASSGLNVNGSRSTRPRRRTHLHIALPGTYEVPLELGAEFVHGRPPDLLNLLHDADAPLQSVEGTDVCFTRRRALPPVPKDDAAFDLLEQLAGCLRSEGDMSFADFLERRQPSAEDAERARSFVEGFNAADARRIGIAALARQQQAEDEIDGDEAARSIHGYDLLPLHLARRAEQAGARILLSSPVTSVQWNTGSVAIHTGSGEIFTASKAILTLPLGVLRARSVAIHPEPSRILAAADRMEARLRASPGHGLSHSILEGEDASMRFLFAGGTAATAYWAHQPGDAPVLVAWAGGPKADAAGDAQQFLSLALRSLERIFSLPSAIARRRIT